MLLTRLQIENFRGIKSLDLTLGETTVLIGENNSGKTTVLHALRACLQYLRGSGRASVFEDFDFHFGGATSDPTTAPPIIITLTFEESKPDEWSEEVERQLGGDASIVMLMPLNDHLRVQLRVTSEFSKVTQEVDTGFDFLDATGKPLAPKSKGRLSALQQLRPLFYLSALRDAGKEFSRTSQFWSPFVKNSQIDAAKKAEIEAQLQEINAEIIEAHGTFKGVREHLSKVQDLVSLGQKDVVSVDAVPARIFDMLNRTQVSIASSTGARLPIARHGEGTQSLTVLMLFDAFLRSELTRKQGVKDSQPIVALEEPEAHLHPSAVRALWKTIRDIKGQKLIATHSGDLLSEVDVGSIRRLYRRGAEVHVGQLPPGLLRNRERQKFDFLVRRTRGELFFARCWLLGEGETEAILFSGAADVLGVDLEQAGVRCVEYRQGDISFFLDAANALGISWHCFTDGDKPGLVDAAKATARLPSKSTKRRHLTILPGGLSIEPYLAANGFLSIFEARASSQKIKNITAKKGDAEYIEQIAKCLGDEGKPAAAHAIVAEMRRLGKTAIPQGLQFAIFKAAALGRRC
jgi:putative ATP-dependent endonuclease of OLD family